MKKIKYKANNRSFLLGLRIYLYETIINDLRNIEKRTIFTNVLVSKNSIDPKFMVEILNFEGERFSRETVYTNSTLNRIDLITSGIDVLTGTKADFFPVIMTDFETEWYG